MIVIIPLIGAFMMFATVEKIFVIKFLTLLNAVFTKSAAAENPFLIQPMTLEITFYIPLNIELKKLNIGNKTLLYIQLAIVENTDMTILINPTIVL